MHADGLAALQMFVLFLFQENIFSMEIKSCNSMSGDNKEHCLQRLASNALDQYELAAANVQFIGVYSNILFRIHTVCGSSYLLRICTPSWRTDVDILSEIVWLQALNRDTDIGVPQPQPDRYGNFIVTARDAESPIAYRCVIMSWLPGVPLGTQLTETNVYKLGALFAQLHSHAANFSHPNHFTQRKMNSLFALGEQDILLSDACRTAFTPQTRDIVEQTRKQVDAAFEHLYENATELCIIHNDLHHNNVKIYQERLHPFDFDFTMWGYPVQDLAVALHGLLLAKPDAFETLQEALRAGYESRAKWPEHYPGQIDTFLAGRVLWATNYMIQSEYAHLKEYLDGWIPHLTGFLETGLLRVK